MNDSRIDQSADAPVSVVIPTHGRPRRLMRLLSSLGASVSGSVRCEVVIVDDGSDVPVCARQIGEVLAGTALASSVRVVRQVQRGPAAARNAGADAARGEVLVFIDDDCTVEPGWLEELLAMLRARPDALVASRVRNGLPDSLYASVSMSLLDVVEAAGARADGSLAFVASAAIACAREGFQAIGGFDTHYPRAAGEDRAFCRAWCASGRRILRAERSLVNHYHALDGAGFWRQQSNYGRGAARYRATHPGDAGRAMPRGFHRRLLLHPLARRDWSPGKRLLALPVVAMSQLAIAYGLWRQRVHGS